MLEISVTPQFRKMFSKLENYLQEEDLEKMEMLRGINNHVSLKVHKLKGAHSKHHCFFCKLQN